MNQQVQTAGKLKFVVVTYNKEYLPITECIIFDKYIEEETDFHLEDHTKLQMIVVSELNSI